MEIGVAEEKSSPVFFPLAQTPGPTQSQWERLRGTGELLGPPEQSVLGQLDFEALRYSATRHAHLDLVAHGEEAIFREPNETLWMQKQHSTRRASRRSRYGKHRCSTSAAV